MAAHRTGETPVLGTTIGGRYTIEAMLGKGGMATVYRARDEVLGRSVALKLFSPGVDESQDLQRKSSEIRLLAALNHPALVTLYDAHDGGDDTGGQAYMVMELAEGPTLAQRLAEGPIAPADVAALGADLAEALHTVHGGGVVHRDVKPSNVLLVPSPLTNREFRPKLADFGIAYLIDSTRITTPGALIGTAAYLSPEQAHGDPLTAASDVYSLGLILLESLTGRRPFEGTAIEVTMARLLRDPEVSSALGSRWSALLRSMLQREPADRPSALAVAESARALVREPWGGGPATAVIGAAELDAARTALLDPGPPTEAAQLSDPAATTVLGVGDAHAGRHDVEDDATTALVGRQSGDTAEVEPVEAAARRGPRRGPGPWLWVVLVAVIAVAIAVALVLTGQGDPSTPLPAVDGELGTHLQQLRESVQP